MFFEGAFLRASTGMGVVPQPALLLAPGYAWALVLTVLALCCGLLWLLSRPRDGATRRTSLVKASGGRRQGKGRTTSPGIGRPRFRTAVVGISHH
jgi:hypothetical protein